MQLVSTSVEGESNRAERLGRTLILLVICLLIAAAICGAATQLGDLTRKKAIILGAGGIGALLAFNLRILKPLLLVGWVFALSYNRMYFSFERFIGDFGPEGPYWIPSDIFLAGLMAIWFWERVILKQPSVARGQRGWPILLPFVLVCLLSLFGASRPIWGVFELLRVLKAGLMFFYIRHNVGRREWWWIISAFVFIGFVQGVFGDLQMALRSAGGLLTTLGLGESGSSLEEASAGGLAVGGWVRATGTMGHPTNLACMLLLTVPLAFALALGLGNGLARAACWVVTIVGFAGMVNTLCRLPTVICIGQLIAIAVILTASRRISVKHTVSLAAISGFLVMLAALPFSDALYRRATEDFSDSVKLRQHYFKIAMERTEPNPFLGIGLNNFGVDFLKYDPDLEWAMDQEPQTRHEMNLRAFLTPHNLYLLLLTETGLLGLLTFLTFASSLIARGVRAFLLIESEARWACLGLVLGMIGVLCSQMVDFTLWVDPNLYSFVIAGGLVSIARETVT